jgi:aldose sugar dehydrogenase
MAFLPDGAMLVTERSGRLRVVRHGVLQPSPVAGVPQVHTGGPRGLQGLMDIALHPRFSENRWVYLAYHKPIGDDSGETVLARGTWNGAALVDVQDIFESKAIDTEASRITFGRDGMLYMSISAPGEPSVKRSQDPNDYAGKTVRLRDDGTIPTDNPYIGRAGFKPGIYTIGHRNGHGLAVNPETDDLWETEQGPNGGDEINVLRPGRNYGWPLVSYGRDYWGNLISVHPFRAGMEDPIVVWLPSIGVTGMTFYTGDLSSLARELVRRRLTRGRHTGNRSDSANRLQRPLGGITARTDADGTQATYSRRAPGTGRFALLADS